jgi:cephalosporin hydroxylase
MFFLTAGSYIFVNTMFSLISGSYKCECGLGYQVKEADPRKCIEVNECEFGYECDQSCVDKIGYYECQCRSSFTLASDGQR